MKEIRVSQKETDRQLKETDRQLKETDKRFNTQWAKLVESLVEGKLVEILRVRGIEVWQTSQRVEVSYKKREGVIQQKEFDILAAHLLIVFSILMEGLKRLGNPRIQQGGVVYSMSSLKDLKKCSRFHS